MGCKGFCSEYKAPRSKTGRRYVEGQKRCQVCEVFLQCEGLYCPCCGYQLRSKPRNSNLKKKFHEYNQPLINEKQEIH